VELPISRSAIEIDLPAHNALQSYFRCSAQLQPLAVGGELSEDEGYFMFDGAVGYGRCAGGPPSRHMSPPVPDLSDQADDRNRSLLLPFDLAEVVTNLRQERYRLDTNTARERITATNAAHNAYYFVRPYLPISVRKHLQRTRLSGWPAIPFPAWPVDLGVETLMRAVMARTMKSQGIDAVPFIWFWPNGADSCAMMTHDVEGRAGREFCPQLMDLDDSFGIKSAFQIVPERSESSARFVDTLRRRGFEVNIHDLNHDGSLFRDRRQFQQRAAEINRHALELGCLGFRSGAMYREQDWYNVFEFDYDMSVPNVAHLEPQRGGCCTVLPYFIGRVLELPLTTIQDYSLFHILNDYSTALWKQQIDIIHSQNGLISFITHPDYLIEERARAVYVDLLGHFVHLREERNVWTALPGEVNRWWRNRQQMTLVERSGSWVIEGTDSNRARVAYATVQHGRLVYELGEADSQ
jgi:hypothetical protein